MFVKHRNTLRRKDKFSKEGVERSVDENRCALAGIVSRMAGILSPYLSIYCVTLATLHTPLSTLQRLLLCLLVLPRWRTLCATTAVCGITVLAYVGTAACAS